MGIKRLGYYVGKRYTVTTSHRQMVKKSEEDISKTFTRGMMIDISSERLFLKNPYRLLVTIGILVVVVLRVKQQSHILRWISRAVTIF